MCCLTMEYQILGMPRTDSPTGIIFTPKRHAGEITKEETELMMMKIGSTEDDINTGTTNVLSSQTMSAIGICGCTLEQEMPSVRFIMVESMLQPKGIPTIVMHHNALLREHMENGHKSSPDQVLENMRVMVAMKVH